MKNIVIKSTILALIIALIALSHACSDTEKKSENTTPNPTPEIDNTADESRFPNERSELAIYMRNFYNDLKANKANVTEKGAFLDVDWSNKYANLKSAKPTDPKDSGPLFNSFADQFLIDLQNFQHADDSNRITLYNGLIESCLACHSEHCGGPMPAIRKLKLKSIAN
ncbi:MAG: hypothetical protein CL840_12965 [Crocinitomicaceae bacterium]|nr:hypothetical protein [Crocinitomicaceae bacterium]|tara:strand:+ start:8110 stop:8613 length:504 start_codon:yes stop_codon:yes gene_type:complete